jgi:hypothetical protein
MLGDVGSSRFGRRVYHCARESSTTTVRAISASLAPSGVQLYTTCLVPLACLFEDAMNLQLVRRLLRTAQTFYGRIRVSFKFGEPAWLVP